MDRWRNKVAVVTGASSGIGAVVVPSLVGAGMIVVGLARRVEKVEDIRKSLPVELQSKLHPNKCDVTDVVQIRGAFSRVQETLGGTDILVNNAGVSKVHFNLTTPDNTAAMKNVLDTNVMAFMICTREAFNSMKARNVDGHVVVVNSILGHKVVNMMGKEFSVNMYCPSKFAVTAMAETYRQEFANAGTKVKITSLSPGVVDTEMITKQIRAAVNFPMLKSEDVADAILYINTTTRSGPRTHNKTDRRVFMNCTSNYKHVQTNSILIYC